MCFISKCTCMAIRVKHCVGLLGWLGNCVWGYYSALSPTVQDLYSQSSTKFYLKEVFFSCGEGRLAHPLSKVQEDFPRVQLGSYPDDSSRYIEELYTYTRRLRRIQISLFFPL